nr:hypothetical protein [Campylobacter jejuni]
HAPFKTGLRAMDFIGLDEKHSLELYKLFNSYKNIKHLFLGIIIALFVEDGKIFPFLLLKVSTIRLNLI